MFRRYVSEKWFLNALLALSLAGSVAIVVLHQRGYWLRPAGSTAPAEVR